MEEAYRRAVEKYDHRAGVEDIEEALAQFEALGDYGDAEKYAAKCRTLLKYAPGRVAVMGAWDGKPIRWRVEYSAPD